MRAQRAQLDTVGGLSYGWLGSGLSLTAERVAREEHWIQSADPSRIEGTAAAQRLSIDRTACRPPPPSAPSTTIANTAKHTLRTLCSGRPNALRCTGSSAVVALRSDVVRLEVLCRAALRRPYWSTRMCAPARAS